MMTRYSEIMKNDVGVTAEVCGFRRYLFYLLVIFVVLWVSLFVITTPDYWCCFCRVHNNRYDARPSVPSSSSLHNISNEPVNILEDKRDVNISMKQVCYYWIPRSSNQDGNITMRDLDPTICTHIVISDAIIENNTIVPLREEDVKVYSEVVALKKQNANLHVLICIANGFPSLVRDPHAVAIFAFNVHQFLVTHKLDGVDLDWEFPAWPWWQRDRRERNWFTYLVMQLNNALKLASHPPKLLTIAVGAPQTIIDRSYEVSELAKYVDYVSIMGYDYHMFMPYMPFTGHNAPLSKRKDETGFLSTLNIQWATNYWLKKGMPKEKLVVGIPTYGRTWKLLSRDWYNIGAPAVDVGMLGGEITYLEACIFIKEGATRLFDKYSQVPYAVRDRDWVSFEDPESIKAKAEWIKDMGVAGVMTWNLNSDDWAGLCSGKKYELHSIIRDIIRKQ